MGDIGVLTNTHFVSSEGVVLVTSFLLSLLTPTPAAHTVYTAVLPAQSVTMISVKLISLFSILLYHAVAFVPTCQMVPRTTTLGSFVETDQLFASQRESSEEPAVAVVDVPRGLTMAAAAGLSAFFQVGAALAAEELEIAELPPPYVPALFGVLLIAGVGVLTSSLGDVYTEESSLGMQSGARAKKERDRSRSSYFRK